jgi:hypothetical protein
VKCDVTNHGGYDQGHDDLFINYFVEFLGLVVRFRSSRSLALLDAAPWHPGRHSCSQQLCQNKEHRATAEQTKCIDCGRHSAADVHSSLKGAVKLSADSTDVHSHLMVR